MTSPAPDLSVVRSLLDTRDDLVRAVASGRQRNTRPPWRRAELRYVNASGGIVLQVTEYDETQAYVRNVPVADVGPELDAIVGTPYANWFVKTRSEEVQARVSKRGKVFVHRGPAAGAVERAHDRTKQRPLDASDPVFVALGISDGRGVLKPSRTSKFRQVQDFVASLDAVVADLGPSATVVDLGCGNAYLTFAAHRYLTEVRGIEVRSIGVDVKDQARAHNEEVARRLGWSQQLTFVAGTIGAETIDPGTIDSGMIGSAMIDGGYRAVQPDLVMALHACDTATDEAIAQAVRWRAPRILAAPCCHHDIAEQLRQQPAPAPYALVVRHGILRERLADVLTDAIRAAVLRLLGYRVDVVEFVDSAHTPRNTLIRAVHTGAGPTDATVDDYARLLSTWRVRPALSLLLADELAAAGVSG